MFASKRWGIWQRLSSPVENFLSFTQKRIYSSRNLAIFVSDIPLETVRVRACSPDAEPGGTIVYNK